MYGLNIGSRYLSSVRLSLSLGKYLVKDHNILELPDGLIRPSHIDLNIKDPARLKEYIRSLVPKRKMQKRISLSLPDLAVKASILELEKIPKDRKELEKILTWKIEKDSISPLKDIRLSYQILYKYKPKKGEEGRYRILVSMIKKEILAQYEEFFSSLGLWPILIDISSFHIFNLYYNHIYKGVPKEDGFIFLNIFENFTLMIFKEGILDYIRIKAFRGGADDALKELLASLAIYGEKEDLVTIKNLFVFGDNLRDELVKMVEKELGITSELLDPRMLHGLDGITSIIEEESASLIPALAAAIGR